MRREPLTILSAVVLSLNLLLNMPTALAFTDERFDAQFLQAMGFAIAISGDTVIAGTSSQFSIPSVYIFQ